MNICFSTEKSANPAFQLNETTDWAQTPEQVQIFEKWQRTEPANLGLTRAFKPSQRQKRWN
jgi:hypothetical protein